MTLKTRRSIPLPTVLLVGPSPAFEERCRALGADLRVFIRVSDVPSLTNAASRLRPRVILMTDDVHAQDPAEFEALARDVQAKLTRVRDEDIDDVDLELDLGEAVAGQVSR